MKRGLTILGILAAVAANASIVSVSSGDALVGNRGSNLVTNGSFEADAGTYANLSYWATGTANTPSMSLTSWSATGKAQSYAWWGFTSPGELNGSAPIPDGERALYFGALVQAPPSIMPTFQSDGQVTFAGTPTFSPNPTFGPVTLSQTLTGLVTSQTYLLDFWASGENARFASWADGFFGLDITGENTLYFAAAGGQSGIGSSQRYYVAFQPTSSSVTLTFTNWGHFSNAQNLFTSELVLDDVIVNTVVPEPGTVLVLGLGGLLLIRRRR